MQLQFVITFIVKAFVAFNLYITGHWNPLFRRTAIKYSIKRMRQSNIQPVLFGRLYYA